MQVEDFKGVVVDERNDSKGLLSSVLHYCYQNPSQTHICKYIDLYDDTILNSLQVKDLISDLEFLKQQECLMDEARVKLLSDLIELSKVALKEPHQYLKFYGD